MDALYVATNRGGLFSFLFFFFFSTINLVYLIDLDVYEMKKKRCAIFQEDCQVVPGSPRQVEIKLRLSFFMFTDMMYLYFIHFYLTGMFYS